MPSVPTTAQVLPGAAVDIVLKADQPTGRRVSGLVGQILTPGNHPRGIKVRLTDGRVGRVQAMGTSSASGITRELDCPSEPRAVAQSTHRWERRDIRRDENELPSREIGLDAYVREARPRARNGPQMHPPVSPSDPSGGLEETYHDRPILHGVPPSVLSPDVATCPVCHDFTGDEMAVNHHVSTHFDS